MKMKKNSCKRALMALLLLLPLALSGCYANTPSIGDNTGDLFVEYPAKSMNPVTNAPTNAGTTGNPVIDLTSRAPGEATGTAAAGQQTPIILKQETVAPVTAIPTVNQTASATATPPAVLKKGAQGDTVRDVQRKLRSLGFLKGEADGDFGDATEAAVKRFQKQYGLTDDGVVGDATLKALANAKATARPTATAKPTATPTPRPTSKPEYSSNTYLRSGSSGSLVKKLQNRLIELGYLSGTATGDYDSATEAAVYAFQNRNCSYSDGIAGKLTLDALFSSSARKASSSAGIIGESLKEGSTGSAVRTLQTRLKALGYYTGEIDGDFGQGTEDAVRYFQRVNGLTVDGKAGSATTALVYSGSAKSAAQDATPTPRVTATPSPIPDNVYVLVTAPPNGDYVTLERGHYGSLVRSMQQQLKNQGYYTGDVDGYYGEGTENAVKAFQRAKGLIVDGKAGRATLRVLYEGDFPIGS